MFRHRRAKRSKGQALVEFALAATLIFTLLSASVDLGLMFFSMQALRVAAQEGATFGSHPITNMNADGVHIDSVDLNYGQILARVRNASGGPPASAGFINLFDLDNNGVEDGSQGGIIDNIRSPNSYIYIENLQFMDDDLTAAPEPDGCPTTVKDAGLRNAAQFCYVRVTVKYDYKFIFPLAPVFGDTFQLKASFIMHVRSSFIG